MLTTFSEYLDGHNDLAIFLRGYFNNHITSPNFTTPFEDGTLPYHTDLARLRQGSAGGAFWSVFWPCPANATDYRDANYLQSVQATLNQIDVIHRLITAYRHDFSSPFLPASAAEHAFLTKRKLISPLGIEGLHQIGNSAATLRGFYDLGVRYATLTHNCGNRYADAALWESPLRKAPAVHGGVSAAGRRLVREMNRVGLLVDLSHTSVDTQLDVLGGGADGWEGSRAPVIFSHSSVHTLCPHPRNVEDQVLDLLRERNGVVMINFAPDFVSCVDAGRDDGLPDFYPQNSTLEWVAEHVVYIGRRIGFAHVGIGSDFDGIGSTPRGLDDVSKFPDLVAELLRKGVSDDDAAKVVGGNILRVWKEAEAIAGELQNKGEPVLEDDLPPPW